MEQCVSLVCWVHDVCWRLEGVYLVSPPLKSISVQSKELQSVRRATIVWSAWLTLRVWFPCQRLSQSERPERVSVVFAFKIGFRRRTSGTIDKNLIRLQSSVATHVDLLLSRWLIREAALLLVLMSLVCYDTICSQKGDVSANLFCLFVLF